MKINLKLRALTAYFSPCKVALADNEDVTIEISDKGQLTERVVLLCNGKTYLCENKTVTLPRADLQNINVFELQEREHGKDEVLRRVTVENLYVMPCSNDYEQNRLVAERTFYADVFTNLLDTVRKLQRDKEETDKKLDELINGKFTVVKFKKKEN